MATQEFYIRNETDTEARGPFTLEQLSSLIDSGQLTPATMFYDATAEQWASIDSNPDLKSTLFPEKKRLTVRAKEKLDTLNRETDTDAPITVDDMLAAAEGRTADTKDKKDPTAAMARAAGIGRWTAIVGMILAAAGEILPSTDVLMSMDPVKIIGSPLVILGVADVLLALILGLGVVAAYPLVRFRAALGLGFLGFIFWTHGQSLPLLALIAGCTGLYLCTIFISYLSVSIAAVLSLGGLGFVAWRLLS